MKSLIKIYFKYVILTVSIAMAFIVVQMCIYIYACVLMWQNDGVPLDGKYSVRNISQQFEFDENKNITNSEYMNGVIDNAKCEFAFILDDNGNIIWEHNLTDDLNHKYTVSDVASFSKWYLEGYPVSVWETEGGLAVLGYPKDSIWKYNIVQDIKGLHMLFKLIVFGIISSFVFVAVLIIIFGYGYYKKVKVITDGINNLSNEMPVYMPVNGNFKEIALCINKTAEKLIKQKSIIEKRDEARTEWISAVSHDIRTPLSLIMGYAEMISQSDTIDNDTKEKGSVIKEQSIKIKKLIEDLNLASKLEYNMQPLRKEYIRLSSVVRQAVVECINSINEGAEKYNINIDTSPEFDEYIINADKQLMLRAFENIVGNSIRHNRNGCEIYIKGYIENNKVHVIFSDSGLGIPKDIAESINNNTKSLKHIMGLIIVKRIITSHGGKMTVNKGIEIIF